MQTAMETFKAAPTGARAARALRLLRRLLAPVAAAVVYLALAFAMFASTWRDPLTYGVGRPGDSSVYMWALTWVPYALSHGLNPFFTDYADYPAGINLLWNTMVPAAAVALWPITSTLGPLFAYNLMETLAIALSAWTAFVLLKRYVAHPLAAGLGGLLYGFSPYMAAHSVGHTAITLVFLPPLILLVIDEIVRIQRRPPVLLAVALALMCAVQFLISEEVLVTTGIVSVILVVIAAALWPQHALGRVRYAATALFTALGFFVLLVAYPVPFQLFGPQHIRAATPLQAPNIYVNDLLGFWVPSEIQWLAPRRALRLSGRFTGNAAEWNSYLGVPLSLLLVFIAVRWWSNAWLRLAALAGAVVAILSLGITLHVAGSVTDHLPVFIVAFVFLLIPRVPARTLVLLTFVSWLALWRLPLLDSILPGRLMLFGYLFVGLMLAVFVDALVGLGWRRLTVGLTALAVALAPLTPRLPYWTSNVPVPAFFASGGQVARVPAGSVALVAPVATFEDADTMLWQAESNMRYRMPEGYMFVAAPPPTFAYINTPPSATTNALNGIGHGMAPMIGDESLRHMIRAELTDWNVRTVIVGPMAYEDGEVAFLTWAIGRPPERVEGVFVWWDVGDAT